MLARSLCAVFSYRPEVFHSGLFPFVMSFNDQSVVILHGDADDYFVLCMAPPSCAAGQGGILLYSDLFFLIVIRAVQDTRVWMLDPDCK